MRTLHAGPRPGRGRSPSPGTSRTRRARLSSRRRTRSGCPGSQPTATPVATVTSDLTIAPAPGGAWGPCANASRVAGATPAATSVLWGRISAPASRTVVLTGPADAGDRVPGCGRGRGPAGAHRWAHPCCSPRPLRWPRRWRPTSRRGGVEVLIVGGPGVVSEATAAAVGALGVHGHAPGWRDGRRDRRGRRRADARGSIRGPGLPGGLARPCPGRVRAGRRPRGSGPDRRADLGPSGDRGGPRRAPVHGRRIPGLPDAALARRCRRTGSPVPMRSRRRWRSAPRSRRRRRRWCSRRPHRAGPAPPWRLRPGSRCCSPPARCCPPSSRPSSRRDPRCGATTTHGARSPARRPGPGRHQPGAAAACHGRPRGVDRRRPRGPPPRARGKVGKANASPEPVKKGRTVKVTSKVTARFTDKKYRSVPAGVAVHRPVQGQRGEEVQGGRLRADHRGAGDCEREGDQVRAATGSWSGRRSPAATTCA